MQGVIGGKAHVTLTEHHHGDGKTLRQCHEMSYCLKVPSYCARDDQRTFGTRQGRSCRLNALGVWIETSAAVTPRWGRHAELGVGFPQDLTRQGQIDWPTMLRPGSL